MSGRGTSYESEVESESKSESKSDLAPIPFHLPRQTVVSLASPESESEAPHEDTLKDGICAELGAFIVSKSSTFACGGTIPIVSFSHLCDQEDH